MMRRVCVRRLLLKEECCVGEVGRKRGVRRKV